MKLLKYFFLILVLTSFYSPNPKTDLTRENLHGKVKTVAEYGYSGKIGKAHLSTFKVSTYNLKGELIETRYLTRDSILIRKAVPTHNGKGQIIQQNIEDPTGKYENWHINKFDLNSNKTETTVLKEGTVLTVFHFLYNKKNLCIEEVRGLPGTPSYKLNYTYDSLDNVSEMKQFNLKTKLLESNIIYSYKKFDKHKNWLQRDDSVIGKPFHNFEVRRIEYYE